MKRALSFLMTFALLITSFSNVAFAEEASYDETTGTVVANVEEGPTVEVELRMGETVTHTQDGSIEVGEPIFGDQNSDIVQVEVIPGKQISYPYVAARLGTETVAVTANNDIVIFGGEEVELEECLFTFTDTGNNTYYISHGTGENAIYLAHGGTGAVNGKPCRTEQMEIEVAFDNANDMFTFKSSGAYLYFHKTSLRYDKGSSTGNDLGYRFDLFTPTEEEQVNPKIKGYKKLSDVSDIENGKAYLIASEASNGSYYILNPVADAQKHNYVAQVVTYSAQEKAKVQLANNSGTFDGELKMASDCLFTFTSTGEANKYKISANIADGTTVYLNHRLAGANIPTTTRNEAVITVASKSDSESSLFLLYDNSNSANGGLLYFHRDSGYYYNRNSGIHNYCYFELYEPSPYTCSPIAGFAKVTSMDDIKDGGQYLIVSKDIAVTTNYYLMYPSAGTNKYNHVAKLASETVVDGEVTDVICDTEISFTGKQEGKTSITISGVTYNVNVKNEERTITLINGESEILPGSLQREVDPQYERNVKVIGLAPYTKVKDITEGYFLLGIDTYMVTNTENSSGTPEKPVGLGTQSANYFAEDCKQHLWKVTEQGEAYTMQNVDGKYINFTNKNGDKSDVILSDNAQKLSIFKRSDGSYGISYDGHYLNRYGGDESGKAAGWHNDGNAWYFYRGIDAVEVTSTVGGSTTLTVGGVDYDINFINTEALDEAIRGAEAAGYVEADYILPTWTVYQSALEAAKECLENPRNKTQSDIDTAKTNLENAIENLIEIPETENSIKTLVTGYSLVLNGNIGVKFHMWIDETVVDEQNLYMKFTLGEGSEPLEVSLNEENMVDGYYVFECPVPVKDMDTKIEAQIVLNDGRVSDVFTYTVGEYIDSMKADTTGTYATAIKLVEAMEDFGDYAAFYFTKDTEGGVEKPGLNVPVLDDADRTTLAKCKPEIIGDTDIYAGSSLLLKTNTILRHYFNTSVTINDDNENFDVSSTQKGESNYYYIDSAGIGAHELATALEVTVTDSTSAKSVKITYSPLSYANLVLTSEDESVDEDLKDLMKVMYNYYKEAYYYKHPDERPGTDQPENTEQQQQ